jgi:membrane-associated protease RseP (regulator of RpoE activity)
MTLEVYLLRVFVMSLIISIIGFAALAMMVHELGHLLAARSCGVPASELGLGMGPRLAGFRLGGIIFNVVAGWLTYGTTFGWLNLLLAAGNILPLYQHDGWKCGVVIMRALLRRKSEPAERVFTFSGGFVSLLIAWAVVRMFI